MIECNIDKVTLNRVKNKATLMLDGWCYSDNTEITGIIEQQTASFNQIVITLRQISSGIESFAQSTKTITNTVNEMKNIAFKLSNMKDHI